MKHGMSVDKASFASLLNEAVSMLEYTKRIFGKEYLDSRLEGYISFQMLWIIQGFSIRT